MRLDLTDMLYALSYALDKVETELLGIDNGHGKRVAYLSLLMGKEAGFSENELRDFIGCCILHDNALTEFIHEELEKASSEKTAPTDFGGAVFNESRHSVIGEQNISLMPFGTDVKNIILYHHENADGSGAMGKSSSQTNLKSQILHLADICEMKFHFNTMTESEYRELYDYVLSQSGKAFSSDAVGLFRKSVGFENIKHLRENRELQCLKDELKTDVCDYSDKEIHNISMLFARIVDYKSRFTRAHSMGVAARAEKMARFYGFSPEKTTRFYFAGAMHDIGKLAVSNDILEKPDRLDSDEFDKMKNHASATFYILSQIKEIPDIIKWASNHHEKLNGKGYPRGLTADDLSFEERLMACIDIYQALTEKRPYKDGFPHEKAISIMREMADKGELDSSVINDMDKAMKKN